jgi:cadmium resistance protein CadD (predicted permease)
MSFGIYLIGYLLFTAGLIYGATLLHLPTQWIVMLTLVLLGLGIVTGVKNTRSKDPS